jgi:uncharacterized protein with HEPN domain
MTKKTRILGPAPGIERVRKLAKALEGPKFTPRQWLVQGLLPGGFPAGRRDIPPARMLELINRFPSLYRHADSLPGATTPPFAREALAIGGGWFDIVSRLSEKLTADPTLVVAQFKEKYGRMTVYLDRSEPASQEVDAAIDAALEEANDLSVRTCEDCGEPGVHAKRGHTVGVLCEACYWLTDMVEACRRLADYTGKKELPAFAADGSAVDAAMLALRNLGEGARHQSPERRALLPNIDWKRLDSFRAMTGITGGPSMSVKEIWEFPRDEVPVLAEALR